MAYYVLSEQHTTPCRMHTCARQRPNASVKLAELIESHDDVLENGWRNVDLRVHIRHRSNCIDPYGRYFRFRQNRADTRWQINRRLNQSSHKHRDTKRPPYWGRCEWMPALRECTQEAMILCCCVFVWKWVAREWLCIIVAEAEAITELRQKCYAAAAERVRGRANPNRHSLNWLIQVRLFRCTILITVVVSHFFCSLSGEMSHWPCCQPFWAGFNLLKMSFVCFAALSAYICIMLLYFMPLFVQPAHNDVVSHKMFLSDANMFTLNSNTI